MMKYLWMALLLCAAPVLAQSTDEDAIYAPMAPYLNITPEESIALGHYCDKLSEDGAEKAVADPRCMRQAVVMIYFALTIETDPQYGRIVPADDAAYLYTTIKKYPQSRDYILFRAIRDAGPRGKAVALSVIECAKTLPPGFIHDPDLIGRDCRVALTHYFRLLRYTPQEAATLLEIVARMFELMEKTNGDLSAVPAGAWNSKDSDRFFRILVGADAPSREDFQP